MLHHQNSCPVGLDFNSLGGGGPHPPSSNSPHCYNGAANNNIEIAATVESICGNLYNKLPRRRVDVFSEELALNLVAEVEKFWSAAATANHHHHHLPLLGSSGSGLSNLNSNNNSGSSGGNPGVGAIGLLMKSSGKGSGGGAGNNNNAANSAGEASSGSESPTNTSSPGGGSPGNTTDIGSSSSNSSNNNNGAAPSNPPSNNNNVYKLSVSCLPDVDHAVVLAANACGLKCEEILNELPADLIFYLQPGLVTYHYEGSALRTLIDTAVSGMPRPAPVPHHQAVVPPVLASVSSVGSDLSGQGAAFTTASFAATKFGSTKVRAHPRRPTRLSPSDQPQSLGGGGNPPANQRRWAPPSILNSPTPQGGARSFGGGGGGPPYPSDSPDYWSMNHGGAGDMMTPDMWMQSSSRAPPPMQPPSSPWQSQGLNTPSSIWGSGLSSPAGAPPPNGQHNHFFGGGGGHPFGGIGSSPMGGGGPVAPNSGQAPRGGGPNAGSASNSQSDAVSEEWLDQMGGLERLAALAM